MMVDIRTETRSF